jgi:sortase A
MGSLRLPLLLTFLAALGLAFFLFSPRQEAEPQPAETALEAVDGVQDQPRPAPASAEIPAGDPDDIRLSVPRLGIRDLRVPTAATQAELDREGIVRLGEAGLPWAEGSNTFIVGHALGYPETEVRYVFQHLEEVQPGDRIVVKSAGKRYVFRVYDRLTVQPEDYWVTHPVTGKTVISLQSCTPYPTFENRLVIRGELIY